MALQPRHYGQASRTVGRRHHRGATRPAPLMPELVEQLPALLDNDSGLHVYLPRVRAPIEPRIETVPAKTAGGRRLNRRRRSSERSCGMPASAGPLFSRPSTRWIVTCRCSGSWACGSNRRSTPVSMPTTSPRRSSSGKTGRQPDPGARLRSAAVPGRRTRSVGGAFLP
jgi:hypothetical protein